MSGIASPLTSGVPIRCGMPALPQPEAPYSVSTPPAELAAAASEVRSTPPPEAAMPLRSSSLPVTSVR
ncbi:hypothetical protein SVIOM342S_01489 [Streptomyces violaceorubidus]